MSRLVPAFLLLLALAAGLGGWQLISPRRAPAAAPPKPRAPQAAAKPVTARPAPASTHAVPDVPAPTRGKIIRQRVRHFPHKLLALTFDDGPDPKITPLVLAALKQHDARATFFVLGKSAKRWPQYLKQEAAAGHAVASHSYSHPSRLSGAEAASQLDRTAAIIREATGRRPQLFRPPYGITKGALCQTALQQGYAAILWTISTADSNPIGPSVIAHNAIHTPNPGDIILMHDGPGHLATARALPQILRELSATGFRFVTIPELLCAWQEWQATDKQGTPAPKRKP